MPQLRGNEPILGLNNKELQTMLTPSLDQFSYVLFISENGYNCDSKLKTSENLLLTCGSLDYSYMKSAYNHMQANHL